MGLPSASRRQRSWTPVGKGEASVPLNVKPLSSVGTMVVDCVVGSSDTLPGREHRGFDLAEVRVEERPRVQDLRVVDPGLLRQLGRSSRTLLRSRIMVA